MARWTTLRFNLDSGIQYWLLGFITLLAGFLRFYNLGKWSFWIDEIFNIERAQIHYGSLEAITQNIPPVKLWIPFSTIASSGALNIFGTSEWSARLVPAIIGVISIPVLFFSAKQLFGSGAGLLAALFLTVAPWHIYWSQNARFYTSLMLFSYLALFAFFYGVERNRPVSLLFSLLFLYLAVSERLVALLLVPVALLYLLVLKTRLFGELSQFQKRSLILVLLLGLALASFEFYSFATTGSSILVYAADIFVGRPNNTPPRLLYVIIYQVGLSISHLGFFGGVYLLSQRSRQGLFIFLSAVAPILLLLTLALFALTFDRYIFFVLPFWLILSAVALKEMYIQAHSYTKLLPLGVLALVLASSTNDVLLYHQLQHGNRPDWRGAFAVVQEHKHDKDLVVTTRPEIGRYYLDDKVESIHSLELATVASGHQRVWLVFEDAPDPGGSVLEQWLIKNTELVEVLEIPARGKSRALRVYLFNPTREPISKEVFSGVHKLSENSQDLR